MYHRGRHCGISVFVPSHIVLQVPIARVGALRWLDSSSPSASLFGASHPSLRPSNEFIRECIVLFRLSEPESTPCPVNIASSTSKVRCLVVMLGRRTSLISLSGNAVVMMVPLVPSLSSSPILAMARSFFVVTESHQFRGWPDGIDRRQRPVRGVLEARERWLSLQCQRSNNRLTEGMQAQTKPTVNSIHLQVRCTC